MSSTRIFTSAIGPCLTRYIAHQRALGLSFEPQAWLLDQFDRFLAETRAPDLTPEAFAIWCSSIEHLSTSGRRMRLRLVYRFCLYRRRAEPTCFVPDPSRFPKPSPPPRPYIFSEDEISRLLVAADALPAYEFSPLYSQGARLAIVLLYTTGMRRGELVRLTLGDYQPLERVLVIRDSKFHKSRMIPLSRGASREMEGYLEVRRGSGLPSGADAPLLLHRRNDLSGYSGNGLRVMVRRLYERAGIRTAAGRLPRTHDLRFTFAIHALSRWYRTGADVQSRLPALATYMGHVSVASTQYYLSFVDAIAQSASEKFDRHCSRFLATTADRGGQ